MGVGDAALEKGGGGSSIKGIRLKYLADRKGASLGGGGYLRDVASGSIDVKTTCTPIASDVIRITGWRCRRGIGP